MLFSTPARRGSALLRCRNRAEIIFLGCWQKLRVRTLFWNTKFKDFSRTFKDTFPIFQGFLSAKESLESVFFGSFTTWAILSWRSFCVCSLYALENLGWIKLAPKFKDFPVPTAILRTFKALNFNFKIQGLSRCVTGSRGVWCEEINYLVKVSPWKISIPVA